jgi:hypothetical protein
VVEQSPSPLRKLEAAVQEFINDISSQPTMLKNLVVVFETTRFDDDGDQAYAVSYATGMMTDMAASSGLARLGARMIEDDILTTMRTCTCDDDD